VNKVMNILVPYKAGYFCSAERLENSQEGIYGAEISNLFSPSI
jgi:hypothetical protein